MYRSLTVIAVLVVCVSGRVYQEDPNKSDFGVKQATKVVKTIFEIHSLDDGLSVEPFDGEVLEEYIPRLRRDVREELTKNSDGTSDYTVGVPMIDTKNNHLGATVHLNGATKDGNFKSVDGTLAWENANGLGASLTGEHDPSSGNKLTASGTTNLFHNDNHDVTANVFATRNFPSNPSIPTSDLYGGKVEYTNRHGHGASLTGERFPGSGDKLTASGTFNLFHNDNHDVTANVFATRNFPSNPSIPTSDLYSGKVEYTNRHGHGASLTGERFPGSGDKLTAAGTYNLFHNNKHDLTADAFATRTFPSNPNIPDFNTYGGKLGYTFDKKLEAGLGVQHNDLFRQTDYSAMGKLNLFRDPTTSLDLNAGLTKSTSPYHNSNWEPFGGMTFRKWFK